MASKKKDPTLPIKEMASSFPDVIEGTSCTQASFKVGKKSFFFIGEQGGRFKAMFKLAKELPAAEVLAGKSPDDFQVGKSGWVTARFSAEKPLPKKVWSAWLKDSYNLGRGGEGR